MDPDAALDRASYALARLDLNETLDALDDVGGWQAGGGFDPTPGARMRWDVTVAGWDQATGLSWDTVAHSARGGWLS